LCAATVVAFLSAQLIAGEPAVREPSNTPSSWEFTLSLIGKDLKCYFTLEKVERDGDDPKADPVDVMDDEVFTDIDTALAKLSKHVEGFSFIKNKEHPNVVHVIENCLLKTPEYPLDKKVSVQFSGTPLGLIKSLERQETGIEIRRGGDNTQAFDDDVTEIQVQAKEKTVRAILTDCIPLKGYNPKIWIAETRFERGKPRTIVQFHGPKFADGSFW
jgi:hypothetical protein